MPYSLGWLSEFTNSLSRVSPSSARCGRLSLYSVFPPFEFSGQIPFIVEPLCSVEFFHVGIVASFHLAVYFGTSGWDAAMTDAQVRKMPGELWSE
jgi:hypothetical protein